MARRKGKRPAGTGRHEHRDQSTPRGRRRESQYTTTTIFALAEKLYRRQVTRDDSPPAR